MRDMEDRIKDLESELESERQWTVFLQEWVNLNKGKGVIEQAWDEYQETIHKTLPVRGCACKRCAEAVRP